MSFRNRPVLDRKHRPRWQDELRSQQLIVGGFALAIAVAIGIFAAAAWSSFYTANLRQVALVGGQAVRQGELTERTNIIRSELTATGIDLQNQLGGSRDQIIEQQLQTIQTTLQQVDQVASDSLVTGAVLGQRAAEFGVTVADAEIDAEIAARRLVAERRQLSLIAIFVRKDADAPPDAEPTEENWAAARATIDEIKAAIDGGASFADQAAQRSDDQTKQNSGLLGWVEATDGVFGDYFTAAGDAEVGEVVGPLQNELGWYLLKVEDRQAAGRDELLDDLLSASAITDAEYRAYVHNELLRRNFGDYFSDVVVARYQPQRHVAEIFINVDQGVPVPKLRIRHLLVQPIPGAQDQSTATQEQWDAALAEAEELREQVTAPDADWWEIAAASSDDPGSRSRAGVLGWYDPATLATQFVPEFATAVTALQIGEISEPVRSEFGYHVVEVMDRRTSAVELADRLHEQLQDDPDAFAELAREQSEDITTAREGGDLGWVLHYQHDAARDQAIFDLTEVGEISEPVVTPNGIYIFKLLDTSESRYVLESQRTSLGSTGFNRWLEELKDEAHIWIDPELAPATTTA